MPAASRVSDAHVCPASDGPKPHVGGPVLPPASANVVTDFLPQARTGDRATCVGPPDFVVTGSATVLVNGQPAARLGDKTAHGGTLVAGAATVLIGGASAGSTLGQVESAARAFSAAATGRSSGDLAQSYNNCGVEASRQIINQATGRELGEDELLDWAMANQGTDGRPLALGVPGNRDASGGTTPDRRQAILSRNGVASIQMPATMEMVAQTTAEGRGVIISLDASVLWSETLGLENIPPGSMHAVVATGAEYDATGVLSAIIINDTGAGHSGMSVTAQTMKAAMEASGRPLNVTEKAIW